MKWILLLALPFVSLSAWAYPELTRFQYNNCSACHVSPSGGGLLTSYGRSLSSEVLSTWGSEKEAGFLHGALDREKLEEWVLLGGDVRAVQVHKETAAVKSGRFIKMQADLAAAIVRDHWAVASTVGALEEEEWSPDATSYYALYRPRDEISLRAGRFVPQYGLHINDHIVFARSFLGFGLGATRDTVEAQWSGETWTTSLSTSKQFEGADRENGWSLQTQYFFADRSKIALNYWRGDSDVFTRDLYGMWMILGFTPRIFWIHEMDWQSKNISGKSTRSFVTYNKWGYTLLKGLDALLIGEFQKSDLNDNATEINRWGIGGQFFPRPHFEVSGAWTKQKSFAGNGQEADYAWLLLHYYL